MAKISQSVKVRGLSLEEIEQLNMYAERKSISRNKLMVKILREFLRNKKTGEIENSILIQMKKMNQTNGELIELVDILEKQKKQTLQNINEIKDKLNKMMEG